ncbi:enoyl-[acyl-carrier-protein] reductase (NADH) [Paraburkholderia sp. UCT70]
MSTENSGQAGPLLKGMKALVTGIANEHSIA